jgi:hypothetical protein
MTKHLHKDFNGIPGEIEGHRLHRGGSLNLVLQVGAYFRTPVDGGATRSYETPRTTYYLQEIKLRVMRPHASDWVPGYIHRNREHPSEFDNLIEVIAPDLGNWLTRGLKEWFELDGPFEMCDRTGRAGS